MSDNDEFDGLATLAYQTAFRILGSRQQSEDVAQDTMVKAYVRWYRGSRPRSAVGVSRCGERSARYRAAIASARTRRPRA